MESFAVISAAYKSLVLGLHFIYSVALPWLFYFGHRTYVMKYKASRTTITLPGWSRFTKREIEVVSEASFDAE